MDERSIASLQKLFDQYRIVFWYDDKRTLREDFDALELDGVTKLEIANNEFTLKHRLLREEPKAKFLLYHAGPKPSDEENWLLDILFYQGEFHTDQTAIILSDLGLEAKFLPLIKVHLAFFDSKVRVQQLKKMLSSQETIQQFPSELLAVCTGNENTQFEYSLMALFVEASQEQDEKFRLVQRCNLSEYLWAEINRRYGYIQTQPGMTDLAFELFSSAFAMQIGEQPNLSLHADVFLKHWKDSKAYSTGYMWYATHCEEEMDIATKLSSIDFRTLLDCDLFKAIDEHCIDGIFNEVQNRTASDEKISQWIRKRRISQWYDFFENHYMALSSASKFFTALQGISLSIQSISEGIRLYSGGWKEVDQFYRSYLYHVGNAEAASFFSGMTTSIENHYNNSYLMPLNHAWSDAIERTRKWEASPYQLQSNFFSHYVKPIVDKDNKICVIISDGMRYEVGDQLVSLINGIDKHSAEIEPMLTLLPSYTQLGMAALLPQSSLSFQETGAGVLADGASTSGKAYREKILQKAVNGKAVVFDAESVLGMKNDELRSYVRDNQVIYVYHNVIDKVGDSRDSEERVFSACADALDELQKLVRKLTSANANNLIVTSDHGFLYQNSELDDSDFVSAPISNEGVFLTERRFMVGRNLKENTSMHSFSASALHLSGDCTIQVPRGINRMRIKGSGSRYVHGGASLQEVVVPVVKVNKGRQADTSYVEVDVLKGASNKITSGQLSVTFYQRRPVTDKVKPLTIHAGFYTKQDILISDSKELVFDFTSENVRDRDMKVKFMFSNSPEAMKIQQVELRLEVPIENTNKWKPYASHTYLSQRQVVTDFEPNKE
jgi:uncharacterized protein (TIGR02687 family)